MKAVVLCLTSCVLSPQVFPKFVYLARQEVILEPQTLSWIKHCYTAQMSQVEQGPCVLTTAKKRQKEPESARVIQGEPERACQDPQVFCSQFIMHKKRGRLTYKV